MTNSQMALLLAFVGVLLSALQVGAPALAATGLFLLGVTMAEPGRRGP